MHTGQAELGVAFDLVAFDAGGARAAGKAAGALRHAVALKPDHGDGWRVPGDLLCRSGAICSAARVMNPQR